MTSFGVLMPSDRTAFTPDGDDRTLQVRTRRARDLDILRSLYLPELGETIHTPEFDYNYRAYCAPQQFADAAAKMVLDIDYEKFKPTTDRFHDTELHRVYNSIWGVVTRLGTPWEAFSGRDPSFVSKSGKKATVDGFSDPLDGLDDALWGYDVPRRSLEPIEETDYRSRRARRVGAVVTKPKAKRNRRGRATQS